MKDKTCCFSGHRDIQPFMLDELKEKIEKVIEKCIDDGYCRFLAGGALGFDTLAANAVLKLKEKYPFIRLILVLPYMPYKKKTKRRKQEGTGECERIKAEADEVVCLSESYYRGCLHVRNRWLVDNSSLCICCLTHDSGGTAYTVKYAEKKGVGVVNIGEW